MSWLADYPLWIASYGASPSIPAPWSSWTMWQYDGNGGQRMPNGGDADFNWFNGDEEALASFCRTTQLERPAASGVLGSAAVDTFFKP